MLVIDSSAVVELLLSTATGRLVADIIGAGETLHAPDLLGVEIVSVLRRLISTGGIDIPTARRAVAELGALGVETYEHAVLLPRMLALRDDLTAYDAAYVTLAEALRAPLLTCDRRLAQSSGHRAAMTLIRL